MGKYRGRLQIIADVLSATVDGAKKTHIMYQANLSYELLSRYLSEVMDVGLVSFAGSEDCYRLTGRGREFLKRFHEYSRSRKKLQEQFSDVNNEEVVLKKMLSHDLNSPWKRLLNVFG